MPVPPVIQTSRGAPCSWAESKGLYRLMGEEARTEEPENSDLWAVASSGFCLACLRMPWERPWALGCYGDGRRLRRKGTGKQSSGRGISICTNLDQMLSLRLGWKHHRACSSRPQPRASRAGQRGFFSDGPRANGRHWGGEPQGGHQRPGGCEIPIYKLTRNA